MRVWPRVCVVAWLGGVMFVCVGFMRFLGVVVLVVGLVWLVDVWVSRLSDGFAVFVSMVLGVRLF